MDDDFNHEDTKTELDMAAQLFSKDRELSQIQMTRATELFKISNSRENNYLCRKDYWLNGAVRRIEQPA